MGMSGVIVNSTVKHATRRAIISVKNRPGDDATFKTASKGIAFEIVVISGLDYMRVGCFLGNEHFQFQ